MPLNILPSTVPLQLPDDCDEVQELKCGKDGVSGDSADRDLTIEFPSFVNDTLPLAGGAIVSITISDLKIQTTSEITNIIARDLSGLANLQLQNKLADLARARMAINENLYNVARRNIRVVSKENGKDQKRKAPEVYLSLFKGDTSTLREGVTNPEIVKLCELRYIPKEVLYAILQQLLENTTGFSNVVGSSGRTFQALLDAAEDFKAASGSSSPPSLSDATEALAAAAKAALGRRADAAIDLALELFPVVNISEDELSKLAGDPVIGGYYTVIDDKIYFKSPSLSGRDSIGEFDSVISEDDYLFVEIYSNGVISRAEFDSFKMPPAGALVGEGPDEFPDPNSLEIEIETAVEENGLTVFLSPILASYQVVVPREQRLDTYDDNIEIFTVPLLTQPPENKDGRLATIGSADGDFLDLPLGVTNALIANASKLSPYVGDLTIVGTGANYGYPYFGDVDPHIFFGEKNRPEILLADEDNEEATSKNNRKFFNIGSYSVLKLLTSNRARVYDTDDVPKAWLSAPARLNSDGNYQATFSSSDFDGVDLAALGGSISYAVYLQDSLGQVTRVIGPAITLAGPVPFISEISPSGFAGDTQILVGNIPRISIRGEDFGDRESGVAVTFLNPNGTILTRYYADLDNEIIGVNDTEIIIEPTNAGFSGDTQYGVTVSSHGRTSNKEYIYISSSAATAPPVAGVIPATFIAGDIKSLTFGAKPIKGIPLLRDGQNAQIRLKSKSKLFSGKQAIYAYLAFDNTDKAKSAVAKFALPNEIKIVNQYLVPTNVVYTFGTSLTGDFYKVSNRKAILNFPGRSYQKYNFSSLVNVDKAYLLFTNAPLSGVASTFLSLDDEDFNILNLGDSEVPAFIEPYIITGLFADTGKNYVSAQADLATILSFPSDIFNPKLPVPEAISAYDKIYRLSVLISGVKERHLRRRYTVKINNKALTRISKGPSVLNGNTVIFTFDNVAPDVDGLLPVTVEKRDKNFGVTTDSTYIYRQASAVIVGEDTNYTVEDRTGTITISSAINNVVAGRTGAGSDTITDVSTLISNTTIANSVISGFIGSEDLDADAIDKAGLLFKEHGAGLLFESNTASALTWSPFTLLDLLPSVGLTLGINGDDTSLSIVSPTTDVYSILKSTLTIPSGKSFFSGSYTSNPNIDAAILFFNVRVQNAAAIKFNVPQITKMKAGVDSVPAVLDEFTEESVIPLIIGTKIALEVENTKRDFVVKFGEIVLKPRGRPVKVGKGTYQAVVEIPPTLISIKPSASGKCFDVCASTTNADRNRAKNILGRPLVVDLEKIYNEILFGPIKERMPDIEDLVEKLADAPLQFFTNILDKALAHKELIDSFCDLSFYLLAELKINLNGIRILMIPIQVIFCIIDVICALLNPIKLAKAVIRLFQCLFDLILLLPVIAIPAMFIRLILHLLELIECVIEKTLFIVTAINEISKAISRALIDKNWAAVKALEEVLSEYLFELEADLQFLEPVLSILAIFLQLLQLVFRFPCRPSTGEEEPAACLESSMLAGLIGGVVAPDLVVLPNALVPVGQTYTTHQLGKTTNAFLVEPSGGEVIARETASQDFINSMDVDPDSLRGTNAGSGGITFNATFAPTVTKSTKGFGNPTKVKFKFNSRGESGFTDKYIDPVQTVDAPLAFHNKGASRLRLATFGNLYSPIDGYRFLNLKSSNRTASVRSLVVEFETPILEIDEETGQVTQNGQDTVSRTYDDIPSLAIMDDEFNVYFIEPEGIKFDNNGWVDEIEAIMINNVAAPKLKFTKEEDEINTTTTHKIYDFPQIYFVDVRQAADQISEACSTSSINSFLYDFNTSDTDSDNITAIVEEAQECVTTYLTTMRSFSSTVRAQQQAGQAPDLIDTDAVNTLNQSTRDCLTSTVDQMCRYTVNTLNTSFQVLEDDDTTPLDGFTGVDLSEDTLDGMEAINPPFTGAREYAAGIGDSASVGVGSKATISIVPRDSYDIELGGDLSARIVLDIISDSTGTASFVGNNSGNIITKNGTEYLAELTANATGIVKIKASICDRTIQALTYTGIEEEVVPETATDCVPDVKQDSASTTVPLGALSKVDRILTIYFVKNAVTALSAGDGARLGSTSPQEFGSALEN